MSANWNWLQDLHRHADEPDRAQAVPVFSGQKLVVVGGAIWNVDGGVMAGRN
jgi:hypothetical protein